MNNVAIFNFVYNYIDNNKHDGNCIHLLNTDPLILLPTPYNNRGINNYSIIISNQNSRYT